MGARSYLPPLARALPHRYPFRLVEKRRGDGGVVVSLTADAAWSRGSAAYPSVLGVEILAQAAILALPEETSDGRGRGLLAGIDHARFLAPLSPGDELVARVEVAGRFGRLIKVAGSLERPGGEAILEAGLLLALDA